MSDEKKKFRNLGTYAVVFVLCVVILIIIAAMADGREQQFASKISAQEQTNETIQNEIVTLRDENYNLTRENDALTTQAQKAETELTAYRAISAAWTQLHQGNIPAAETALAGLTAESLSEKTAGDLASVQAAITAAKTAEDAPTEPEDAQTEE